MSAIESDPDRYKRMAQRAVHLTAVRREQDQVERERRSGPWRAFVAARGGFMAETLGEEWREHADHHVHGHEYHWNATVCSCGQTMGVWTSPPPDDDYVPPTECPVCRDYSQFLASIDLEETS